MKMRTLLAGAAAAALLGFGANAFAGAGWEFTAPGNGFTNGTWDFATAFTVNSAVTVSGLGYYADPVTGNADGNPVAFYQCDDAACSTTGTLLASATVTNIYPLKGHFRYVTITPIDLVPGTSYEVAGVSNADNYTWADPGFATDPAITILTTSGQAPRWLSIGTPDFLTGSPFLDRGSDDGYWGPNVFFGDSGGAGGFTGGVPEPGTWALMLAGVFGLGGVLRLQRREDSKLRALEA
jgi:hypothetical protein